MISHGIINKLLEALPQSDGKNEKSMHPAPGSSSFSRSHLYPEMYSELDGDMSRGRCLSASPSPDRFLESSSFSSSSSSSPSSCCSYLGLILVIASLISLSTSETLQITDHRAAINKLYYHRLPVSISQLKSIKHLKINEVDKEDLPQWLELHKGQDKWELIGLPQAKERGNHYFKVNVTYYSNHESASMVDVFRLEVTDYHQPLSSPNSLDYSPKLSSTSNSHSCLLRLERPFPRILDVWKLIDHLKPAKLQQEIEISDKAREFSDITSFTDANDLINYWSQPLFTISSTIDPFSGQKQYHVSITNQECSSSCKSESKNSEKNDDLCSKLREMGVDFHSMRIYRSFGGDEFLSFNDDRNDFKQPVRLEPSLVLYEDIMPQSIDPILDHNRPRIRRARHKNHQYSTPVLNLEIHGSNTLEENASSNEIETDTTMTRVVPSISSPTASFKTVGSDLLSFLPLSNTPQLSTRRPDFSFGSFNTPFYTTPTIFPEPPTMSLGPDGTTPLFPVASPSSVSIDASVTFSQSPTMISASLSSQIPEPTATFDSTVTEEHSGTKTDSPHSNTSPELRARLPILAITAGKYWVHKIPDSMFYDKEENGGTSKLKLGFYRMDPVRGREHISSDSWIQLDRENQNLVAFPIENDVGLYKNQYFLEAIDSGGLSTTENITFRVRQHTASRKFPFYITFDKVRWDPHKIPTRVEALKSFAQIVSQVYGDKDISQFVIPRFTPQTDTSNQYWRITTTNDSVPAYPCPKELIQTLFNRVASSHYEGQYSNTSEILRTKLGKAFGVMKVSLSIECSKISSPGRKPELRNPIDRLEFKLGEVFRWKVPSNVFFSGDGRSTYDLELMIYDGRGRLLGSSNFFKFDEKSFEITGLAVEPYHPVGDYEFFLVGRTRDTAADEKDAFVVNIVKPWREEEIGFNVTIGLGLSGTLDIDSKLDIANRIAVLMFNDSDCSALRVLKIVKRNYTLVQSGDSTGQDENRPPEGENNVRRRRSDAFEGSFDQMYEFTWTNSSGPLIVKGSGCPSGAIQDTIITKLFGGGDKFSTWDKIFAPKYRLISMEFSAVGKCLDYLTVKNSYRDGLKPTFLPDLEQSEIRPDLPSTMGNPEPPIDIRPGELEDYYLKTFIPLIAIFSAFLVLTFIIICVLIKCRRNASKNQFDVRVVGDGYPSEADVFISKARVPVIFESELQQHLLSTQSGSLRMSSSHQPPSHQHLPMRPMGSSSYQPLPTAYHRRHPPPYK
ncbi:uncharacterized protein LOC141858172 [Brevipalpus obovatus]|uniref:uncharacterized protein LOC141858172 n=1 Tax=Brevipalpus obovatus TaxID=246614 RepID=UPI003D9E64D8